MKETATKSIINLHEYGRRRSHEYSWAHIYQHRSLLSVQAQIGTEIKPKLMRTAINISTDLEGKRAEKYAPELQRPNRIQIERI